MYPHDNPPLDTAPHPITSLGLPTDIPLQFFNIQSAEYIRIPPNAELVIEMKIFLQVIPFKTRRLRRIGNNPPKNNSELLLPISSLIGAASQLKLENKKKKEPSKL